MDAFALYRLPGAGVCTLVEQRGVPASYSSLSELTSEQGFVIAPFAPVDGLPIVVLRSDVLRQCTLDEVVIMQDLPCHLGGGNLCLQPASREAYHEDFSRFHRAFSAIDIQKLVLARSIDVPHQGTHPVNLFVKACKHYPDAFVTLFSAPQCGTWLVATPEVLLARESGRWRTMALAGTMPYAAELPSWNDKNKQEQAFVSQYIKHCLDHYTEDVTLTGPYTTRAGNLVHLRTDFSFTLAEDVSLGDLLTDLHPTPAVCGLPKQEAYRYILDNETCYRSYYSGFSGPIGIHGDTAMFVSLRCMRILDDHYRLYAGGGILPQSEETLEWEETAAKMQAMLSLIQ